MPILAISVELCIITSIIRFSACERRKQCQHQPVVMVRRFQQLPNIDFKWIERIVSATTFPANRCWNTEYWLHILGLRSRCRDARKFRQPSAYSSFTYIPYISSSTIYQGSCGKHNCRVINRGCWVHRPNVIQYVPVLLSTSNPATSFWSTLAPGIMAQRCPTDSFHLRFSPNMDKVPRIESDGFVRIYICVCNLIYFYK